MRHPQLTVFFLITLFFSRPVNVSSDSLPLSTQSRWVVSSSGDRIKLRCVNWSGHLHGMVVEGIHKQPVKDIAARVASLGFNCVRLTWATYMFTRGHHTNLTVAQSLERWNLTDAKAGVYKHNPHVLGLNLLEAQKAVIDELAAHDVMVVLDNHVSLPKWCCADKDGNGFFGDKYFNPHEWLKGLATVARLYKGNPGVIAMSMRNELRGPRQNRRGWYKYIKKGAEIIHRTNPDVLVIVSGLSYDTSLRFLKQKPLKLNIGKKLVYEGHWYPFVDPTEKWLYQPNEFCGNATRLFIDKIGFLQIQFPFFLSEFGMNMKDVEEKQDRYMSCLLAHVAEQDLEWALWSLQGSYILREGKVGMEESFGMLTANWDHVRSSEMQSRLQLIQQMNRDPKARHRSYNILFHPKTGQCAEVVEDGIYLRDCKSWAKWNHLKGGPISLMGGDRRCLAAVGEGLPAIVTSNCSSNWNMVSGSKLHIASRDEHGRYLCLDWDSSGASGSSRILTNKCLCLGSDLQDVPRCEDDPQRQWFKMIPSNHK
ncbi:glycosyl hydrolase 5 family protein-like [Diospyros lotus]|uniref:glycosyl hydrolase 5 family protein-like n=1 Tax=Diospyros lotus TaxID=55363 RepID=UPI00225186AD|nr:glycosyl hydrolase 5 family protein-like [Diospyros lotus]